MCAFQQFSSFRTPLGALKNRELLCWDLPARGLHARPKASGSRPLSVTSHLCLRNMVVTIGEHPRMLAGY